MPVEHWHEDVGDPTVADAPLDRLVSGAHRLELKGESLRLDRAADYSIGARYKPLYFPHHAYRKRPFVWAAYLLSLKQIVIPRL